MNAIMSGGGGGSGSSSSSGHERRFLELLEESALDFDPISLQRRINPWIKECIRCEETAFLIADPERQLYRCYVRNTNTLQTPLDVGTVGLWEQLFGSCSILELKDILQESLRQTIASIFNPVDLTQKRILLYGVKIKENLIAVLCALHPENRSLLCCRSKEYCAVSDSKDCYLRSAGSLLSISLTVERQKYLTKQCEVFLSMAQNVFSNLEDMPLLCRSIIDEAKELVKSEICSLYLVDKENSEVIAQVFHPDSSLTLNQVRLPLGPGIVGAVASSGHATNLTELSANSTFDATIDDVICCQPRNLLCVAVKDNRNGIVAVLMLYNKLDAYSFTGRDEEIALAFAVYCGTSISHCLLYKKLQEAHRRSNMASELMMQYTQKIAEEDVLRLSLCEVKATSFFGAGFDEFAFTPRSIPTQEMLRACLAMFHELGFMQKFRIKRKTLSRFLILVEKGYRDVPYHNWTHAFAVTHFCYLVLKKCPVAEYLTDLERLSLFVAGICHDIDHRGTTNSFQEQSKTYLAQLYSSEGSVLERHHFAQTMCILNMDNCNIFDEISPQDYQRVLDHMRDVILATDLAQHLRLRKEMQAMLDSGYRKEDPKQHYLLSCLLITACDLADQTKHWTSSKEIAGQIYKEFFSQGDLEKAMGNEPQVMMDRDRACIPKLQIDFLDTIALPVYKMLSSLYEEIRPVYNTILHNRRCWTVLPEVLEHGTKGHGNCNLACLYNKELEKEVLRIVDKSPPPSQRPASSSTSKAPDGLVVRPDDVRILEQQQRKRSSNF